MTGPDVLPIIIAVRLSAVALVGLLLLALPPQTRGDPLTCALRPPTGLQTEVSTKSEHQVHEDEALKDMLLHD
jgi:hypothetical protein